MVITLPKRDCLLLRQRASQLISVALISLASLAACAAGSAHQNFKNIMSGQIGKDADSPSARAARNPANLTGVKTLPNGNIEEAYTKNRGACRHYFEIDQSTRKIVGWRYEGSQQDCVIVP